MKYITGELKIINSFGKLCTKVSYVLLKDPKSEFKKKLPPRIKNLTRSEFRWMCEFFLERINIQIKNHFGLIPYIVTTVV